MEELEIQCAQCGEKEKEEIQKIENDKAWKIKQEKDLKLFEESLAKWNVVTLDEAKPQSNEQVLYAIGNGFDIMHRVKSSYADFGKTLGKNSNLRFYLENYLDVDDLGTGSAYREKCVNIKSGLTCLTRRYRMKSKMD